MATKKTDPDLSRLEKHESAANVARAKADAASARAQLTRAQIEASGKQIVHNWGRDGKMTRTIVPPPAAAKKKR